MENVAATGTTDKKLEQYYQNYFSGEQCRMYFSTDQTGENAPGFNFIEYSINSNKSPVYGYGDKYYRIVANGNYLVQGRMGFNLTSRDRLNKIFSATIPAGITQSNASLVIRKGRNPSLGDISKVINSKSLDGAMLNAVREAYKKLYWGTESGIKRYRFDEMDLDENGDVNPRGFDITLIFGYPYGTYSQYFVKTITSAHILGESMQVTDDGRNTLIVFDYFARAVDDAPTTYDKLTINAQKLDNDNKSIQQNNVDTGNAPISDGSKVVAAPRATVNNESSQLNKNIVNTSKVKGKPYNTSLRVVYEKKLLANDNWELKIKFDQANYAKVVGARTLNEDFDISGVETDSNNYIQSVTILIPSSYNMLSDINDHMFFEVRLPDGQQYGGDVIKLITTPNTFKPVNK